MRLFALPDGRIDRKDRAQWLTPAFDLYTGSASTPLPFIGGSTVVGRLDAFGGVDAARGTEVS